MPGQIEFVMHPLDEQRFAEFVLEEPGVMFINGPRWPTSEPPASRNLVDVDDDYCIIWSPRDMPQLAARYIPSCEDWYCDSENATIQFLRSRPSGPYLGFGRIASSGCPDGLTEAAVKAIEKRFNRLRRYIKKNYTNSALVFELDPSHVFDAHWVGPAAMAWLRESPTNRVKYYKHLAMLAA